MDPSPPPSPLSPSSSLPSPRPSLGLFRLKVLVVGAGRSGVAAARMCATLGAEVTLADEKSAAELSAVVASAEPALPPSVTLAPGPFDAARFLGAELIVLSPGVPPTLPAIVAAQQAGVHITGEIELASRFVAAPIIAVTGTNGKSTVTSLAGEIARATGRPAFVGGNLGTPLSEAVGTDAATQHGLAVCEVSSFQLETVDSFHPRAAAILNLTPDHLDRHGSMQGYGDAKLRIAENIEPGDVLVVNEDDAELMAAVARHARPGLPLVGYSTLGQPSTDVGGFLDGGDLVLRLRGVGGELVEERYPTDGLALVGRHNLGNALAAFLLLRASGLASPEAVLEGARRFRPLPHRMQLAGERGGVRYYDDSKGTNVAAVVASIDGFPRPFVLIAGGRDKGGSYAPLRDALGKNTVRAVVVIGEAAAAIAAAVEGVCPVEHAASMDDAVLRASRLASSGDAVILSPACSSYDMFKNYEHRGRAFREAVENLPPTP